MQRIWPDPTPLDDAGVRAAYALDRARRPASGWLRANFVASLDGAVAVGGYSRGLSAPADQHVFGLLRMHTDAVLVGAGTLRHEGYRAVKLDPARRAWRREQGLPPYPTLVIVSASLRLDPSTGVFAEAPLRPIVLTHAGSPPERRASLSSVADVVICGESVVDLGAGLAKLGERRLTQVLCEGGPRLLGALVAADLVDELCLTISPQLVGTGPGRIVAGEHSPAARRMRLAHILADGDLLLTRYVRG